MKKISPLLLIVLSVFFASCQTKPTLVREEIAVPSWQIEKINKLKNKFQLSQDSIWLDARSFFQYKLSHIVGSYNIQPAEYFKKQRDSSLRLDTDHFFNARRLSRFGISKESSVRVFGNGKGGNGEEWLLAWYLEYLGVEDVEAYKPFSKSLKENAIIPTLPNSAPSWKPSLQSRLLVSKSNIEKMVSDKSFNKGSLIFLDVRSREMYLSGESGFGYDVLKINIPWDEFIDEDSRPNISIFEQLKQMGFKSNYKIVVWSNEISQAATAVMVLQRFGFGEASLYVGY